MNTLCTLKQIIGGTKLFGDTSVALRRMARGCWHAD